MTIAEVGKWLEYRARRSLPILWSAMEWQGAVTIQVGGNVAMVQDTTAPKSETPNNMEADVRAC